MNEVWHIPKVGRKQVDNFGLFQYGGSISMNYIAYADVQYRYGNRICNKLIRILYDRCLNIFYDIAGRRLTNVFELITPNDLYLYRNDPGNSIFPHVNEPYTMCEIITYEEWKDYPVDSDWLDDHSIQNK